MMLVHDTGPEHPRIQDEVGVATRRTWRHSPRMSYHPRCPLAVDVCRLEMPPLIMRSGDQRVACWVANKKPD